MSSKEDEDEIAQITSNLSDRCSALLAEIQIFEHRLVDAKKSKDVELRGLTSAIQSEIKSLAKIEQDKSRTQDQRLHMLRSTNVTFYEAVWAKAKRSQGVIGFLKRFYWEENELKRPNKKKGAAVDIVTNGGAEWIKLSTITQTRLLFELARQGWEKLDDDNSITEDDDGVSSDRHSVSSDSDEDISILKAAQELTRASRAVRIDYKHPHVCLVLPKISRGEVDRIDELLNSINELGVEVQTADSAPTRPAKQFSTIEQSVKNMIGNEFATLTSTVNVDCTILLAIVSDLTNSHVEKQPWLHTAAKRQIEMEEESNMLPTLLFPAMSNRELVCTREAAIRMQEIVDTIGTQTEKARALTILPDLTSRIKSIEKSHATQLDDSREKRLQAFAELSTHAVPTDWQLPIKIVEQSEPSTSSLPEIAEVVKRELSELNCSVFLYGWQHDITTLTSNRTIVKRIQSLVEESMLPGTNDIAGPRVWLCQTARSLRAKDKNREAGRQDNHCRG